MTTFSLNLAKQIEAAKEQAEAVARLTMLHLFNLVVEKSPVAYPPSWKSVIEWEARKAAGKTKAKSPADGYVGGRFRANWNPSISLPDMTTTEEVDPSGSKTKSRIDAVVGGYKLSETSVFLTNNLDYAQALEEGHSGQAPVGMVRLSVIEVQNDFSINVR